MQDVVAVSGESHSMVVLGIAIVFVFVFSLHVRKFSSWFKFQVNLIFNDFTQQNMSHVK